MRKLITSILLTLYLFVTLGSASLAWISLPRSNVIEDISFNANIETGLEISLDGINYYKDLSYELIEKITRNAKLIDITSSDGIHFDKGLGNNSGLIIKNRDYISFDLYFRTNRSRQNVYLADNLTREMVESYEDLTQYKDKTYIISKGVNWQTSHTYWYGPELTDIRQAGTTDVYYASDAIRISTIEQSPHANLTIEDPIVKIFDLSENELRGFGKRYGALDYYLKLRSNNIVIPDEPKTEYGLTEFNQNNIPNDDKSIISKLRYVDDSGYRKAKVTINIWIEGWDADALDAILNDKIKVQLSFKTN